MYYRVDAKDGTPKARTCPRCIVVEQASADGKLAVVRCPDPHLTKAVGTVELEKVATKQLVDGWFIATLPANSILKQDHTKPTLQEFEAEIVAIRKPKKVVIGIGG